MSFMNEAAGVSSNAFSDSIAAGFDSIRYDRRLSFSPYVRVVLPLDKFVFWVKHSLLSPSTLASLGVCADLPQSVEVACNVHVATNTEQGPTESLDMSSLLVNTRDQVRQFHDTSVNLLWLSSFEGIKFSIGGRNAYYEQASIHHYRGQTIYPVMLPQIIDEAGQLNQCELILSDSTPLWLYMASVIEKYIWLPGFNLPLEVAYLVPDNLEPPYGVIEVINGSQKAVTGGPIYSPNMSRNSYVTEEVKVTLLGCNNQVASDFLDSVLGYCLAHSPLGVNNSPVITDESRFQPELNIRAQKKVILFKVNYYQSAVRDMAVRLISQCIPTFTVEN